MKKNLFIFLPLILFWGHSQVSSKNPCRSHFISKSGLDKNYFLTVPQNRKEVINFKNSNVKHKEDIFNFFRTGNDFFCLKTGRFNNSYHHKIVLYNITKKAPLFVITHFSKIYSEMSIFKYKDGKIYALFGDNGGNLVTLNVTDGKIHSSINFTGMFNLKPLIFQRENEVIAVTGVSGSMYGRNSFFPVIFFDPIKNLSAFPNLNPFKNKIMQKTSHIGAVLDQNKITNSKNLNLALLKTDKRTYIVDPFKRKIVSWFQN